MALALFGWLGIKAAFLLLLALTTGANPLGALVRFDAGWYLGVIQDGYQWPTTGESQRSNLAFFPLFPALAKAVTAVGLSAEQALVAVAVLGSLAAVAGIHQVGAKLVSNEAGLWLALLWSVAPRAHVQVMGYSEGLFTALVAWSLWALLDRRPLLAGSIALFAGLTRPAAVPLIVTFGVIWLVTAWQRRGRGIGAALLTKEFAAAILSGLGFLAYWLYVAARTGHFFGYFDVQRAWGTTMGTPFDTVEFVIANVLPFSEEWRVRHAILAAVLVYLGLYGWLLVKRVDWRVVVFVTVGLLMTLSQQGYFQSYARMLLPLFPLWLPLASSIATWPRWVRWTVLAVLVTLSALWGVDTALMQRSP